MRNRSVELFLDILLIIGTLVMVLTAGKLARDISGTLDPVVSCLTDSVPGRQRWDEVYGDQQALANDLLLDSSAEQAACLDANDTTTKPSQLSAWKRGIVLR